MKYLKHGILYILFGSLFLYVVAQYVPGLGFSVQSEYKDIFVIFLFLGVLSWFFNVLVKGLLTLLTLPISMITFGLSSLIVNFLLLYVFEQFVNYLDVGVVVSLGTVLQVFIMSCILSLVYFIIKKI